MLVEKVMLENVSFDLVEKFWKTEEEVCTEVERVLKIVEDFHNKISASKNIEE